LWTVAARKGNDRMSERSACVLLLAGIAFCGRLLRTL
jgi:hypothetical protein